MAAPTEDQIKALLLAQVGDPDGALAEQWAVAWALSAGVAPLAARIATAKLALIDVALGAASQVVSFSDGDYSQTASDRAKRLLELRAATVAQLEAAQQVAGGSAIGQLVTESASPPPSAAPVRPYGPDAHDAPYFPSPYSPGRRGRVRRW